MGVALYILAALLVGAASSVQPAVNAILARAIGNPYGATVVSVFVAFCTILLISQVTGRGQITPSVLASLPWWVYLGGVVGAVLVASGVIIAPVTGALLFFILIVAGQLLGAMLMDHLGAFGLAVREVSFLRVCGFLLVLVGAAMVLRG
jgi:transporter family-2 protein